MPNMKDNVISLIEKMPANSSLEDIMEHLYIKQKILKGEQDLKEGRFYTHEEAKVLMEEWLK